MKTIKIAVALILIMFISIGLTAQDRETYPVTLDRIAENVYQILGGQGANGGLIVGEDGVMVIDSKMDEISVRQTIEAIRTVTDQPVKFLINTHSDGDHIMGNRYFPATVTVIAHNNCRDDFFKENFGRASDWGEPENLPFTPSVTFQDNMNIWLGKKKIELHYFGAGHTTGDIVIYDPEEKVAFIGDQYFASRPQLIHSLKNGNSFEHVKTLTKMLETLDADKFLSGHSDPAGRDDIKKHINAMVERQKKVEELIGQDKSLIEIQGTFEDNEARLIASIYNELTGH